MKPSFANNSRKLCRRSHTHTVALNYLTEPTQIRAGSKVRQLMGQKLSDFTDLLTLMAPKIILRHIKKR